MFLKKSVIGSFFWCSSSRILWFLLTKLLSLAPLVQAQWDSTDDESFSISAFLDSAFEGPLGGSAGFDLRVTLEFLKIFSLSDSVEHKRCWFLAHRWPLLPRGPIFRSNSRTLLPAFETGHTPETFNVTEVVELILSEKSENKYNLQLIEEESSSSSAANETSSDETEDSDDDDYQMQFYGDNATQASLEGEIDFLVNLFDLEGDAALTSSGSDNGDDSSASDDTGNSDASTSTSSNSTSTSKPILESRRGNKKGPSKPKPIYQCNVPLSVIKSRQQHFLPYGDDHPGDRVVKPVTNKLTMGTGVRLNFFKEHGITVRFMGHDTKILDMVFNIWGFVFKTQEARHPGNDFRNGDFGTTPSWNTRGMPMTQRMINDIKNDGVTYFRYLTHNDELEKIELLDINKKYFGIPNFDPKIAFIWTIEMLPSLKTVWMRSRGETPYCDVFNNFQIVVISDGPNTYTMVNYGDMGWGGWHENNRAGFGDMVGLYNKRKILISLEGHRHGWWNHRFTESNVNFTSRYVFKSDIGSPTPSTATFKFNSEPQVSHTDFEMKFHDSASNIQDILSHRNLAGIHESFVGEYIKPHGCWCTKLEGDSYGFGGKTSSDMDKICKQWHQCRVCTKMTSCNHRPLDIGEYQVRHDTNFGDKLDDQYVCHSHKDDPCAYNQCKCDLYLATNLVRFLENPDNMYIYQNPDHIYLDEDECRLETAEIKREAVIEVNEITQAATKVAVNLVADQLVKAIGDLNENLHNLEGDIARVEDATSSINTNMNILFNDGNLDDEADPVELTDEDLDQAVVFPHDACCGKVPIWKPYSSQLQKCINPVHAVLAGL